MTEEERLKEKLRAVEALFAGTTNDGEREAAARTRERIIARIAQVNSTSMVEFASRSTTIRGIC